MSARQAKYVKAPPPTNKHNYCCNYNCYLWHLWRENKNKVIYLGVRSGAESSQARVERSPDPVGIQSKSFLMTKCDC